MFVSGNLQLVGKWENNCIFRIMGQRVVNSTAFGVQPPEKRENWISWKFALKKGLILFPKPQGGWQGDVF